jgi:predicted SAM-dependent methyltransferase
VSDAPVVRLNWGCGPDPEPGWINSDLMEGAGIDISCDIREGIPLDDGSIDYIVSIHALPMISYGDLVPVLEELRRLLKPGGVLRLALPDVRRGIRALLEGDREYFLVPDEHVRSLGGKFVVHMLWYGHSVTLFTDDFVEELLERAEFSRVTHCQFRQTASRWPEIVALDDRENESLFVEAVK